MELAHAEYQKNLRQELSVEELPGDDVYQTVLVECEGRIDAAKDELAIGQITAGIASVIELVCIRGTITTLTRMFGKTVARQTTTMMASLGMAAADGPLPVGDILGGIATAGCTVWSGYDIYKAAKVLPAQLAQTLEESANECERMCRENVSQAGKALLDQFRKRPTDTEKRDGISLSFGES